VPVAIQGVVFHQWVRHEDFLTRRTSAITRIGGVNYAGSPAATGAFLYRRNQTAFERSPATGRLWTRAEVNAMQAGIRVEE
jgi:hypothetical protein